MLGPSTLHDDMTWLEEFVLTSIAGCLPGEERESLVADINAARVRERSADGASVLFDIEQYERPTYEGQRPYSMEASMKDADGEEIWIIAFADQNCRLLELEFIRWADGDIIDPDPKSFQCRDLSDVRKDTDA